MRYLFLMIVLSGSVSAQVLLKDIGGMGLASHDLFTWNKETKTNEENGRLDLSTIFDYEGGSRWEKGGNKKNAENAPVYTVTMYLISEFKKYGNRGASFETARKLVVKKFHSMVKESFQRLTGLTFPNKGIKGPVTNTEQAVMRALHDILPGKVKAFNRKRFGQKRDIITITNIWNAKILLNKKEMNQEIGYFNGDYDPEYLKILVPFKYINLKEIDAAYISEFSAYNQSEMLEELKRVGEGEIKIHEVSFIHHMSELFSKAICSDNKWMPKVTCE